MQNQYLVRPTATPPHDQIPQYSDISMAGLLNAHMTNIAAERHTLWLRFSVMVVVHAFILRGLWTAIHETGKHPIGPLMLVLACLAGLVLCAMWFGLIWRAWTILRVWEDIAKRFSWSGLHDPESNPFMALEMERKAFRGKYLKKILRFTGDASVTRHSAYGIIIVFGLSYIALAIHYWFG